MILGTHGRIFNNSPAQSTAPNRAEDAFWWSGVDYSSMVTKEGVMMSASAAYDLLPINHSLKMAMEEIQVIIQEFRFPV